MYEYNLSVNFLLQKFKFLFFLFSLGPGVKTDGLWRLPQILDPGLLLLFENEFEILFENNFETKQCQ